MSSRSDSDVRCIPQGESFGRGLVQIRNCFRRAHSHNLIRLLNLISVATYLRNPLPEHREHVGNVGVPALQLPAAGLARGVEEGVLEGVALGADGRVHGRVRHGVRPRRRRHDRPDL